MEKSKLNHFKELLEKEKEEVQATLDRMDNNEPNASLREYYDELSTYDNHPADIASETYEMEMNFNLKNNQHLRLEEVNTALDRVIKGDYGNCITCGKTIPEERLEILPTALQCVECEEKERTLDSRMETRPIEEEVISPPFARSFKDEDKNYNGFDGEDAWQAVARYNKTDPHNMALDWYDNNMYDENVSGTVEDVENISNEYYLEQLEDEQRRDIPNRQKKDKK